MGPPSRGQQGPGLEGFLSSWKGSHSHCPPGELAPVADLTSPQSTRGRLRMPPAWAQPREGTYTS